MKGFASYVRRNPSLGWGLGIMLALLLFSTAGRFFINREDAYALATLPDLKPMLDREELAKMGEVQGLKAKLHQMRLGLRPSRSRVSGVPRSSPPMSLTASSRTRLVTVSR